MEFCVFFWKGKKVTYWQQWVASPPNTGPEPSLMARILNTAIFPRQSQIFFLSFSISISLLYTEQCWPIMEVISIHLFFHFAEGTGVGATPKRSRCFPKCRVQCWDKTAWLHLSCLGHLVCWVSSIFILYFTFWLLSTYVMWTVHKVWNIGVTIFKCCSWHLKEIAVSNMQTYKYRTTSILLSTWDRVLLKKLPIPLFLASLFWLRHLSIEV